MLRWGMLSYHYLAKNLGVSLTSLPWLPPPTDERGVFGAPFKINEHGLALWFTTPLYFWLLWPRFDGHAGRERRWLYVVAALSAALPATMDLLYQNTGWRQFGYRFSNDYAVLLFVLLAVGARPMRWLFATAAAWGVAWNLFGAVDVRQGAVRPVLLPRRIADGRLPAGLSRSKRARTMKTWLTMLVGLSIVAVQRLSDRSGGHPSAPPGVDPGRASR